MGRGGRDLAKPHAAVLSRAISVLGGWSPTLQGRRYISESFPLSAASTASSFQVVADCHSLSSSYIQVAHGLFPLLGLTATSVRYQQNLIENPFLFFVVFCFLFQVTTNAGTV